MHQASPPFAAFIGIDWADKKHDVCLHEDPPVQRTTPRRRDNALGVVHGTKEAQEIQS